jgi:translocator protein
VRRSTFTASAAAVVATAVSLLLNAGWSWVFFNRRYLAAAVAVNATLTASSADLARRAIAVVVSTHIWLLNRRVRVAVS